MTITRIDVPTAPPRLGSTIAIPCRVHTSEGVVWAVVRPGAGGWTGDISCPIVSVDGNAKRSIDGTHHHVSGKHLGLYFSEIDFKYNTRASTDGARTVSGIARVGGKRLMLRKPKGGE